MPGCAAVGCHNRSEKGYIMKCFPRDPKLRKLWQERVARADWEPSNNSFLCHVHFESEEWSVTQSGRIRLRKNAVPSIFNVTSTRKSAKKRVKPASGHVKNDTEERENDYATEYLENDTEHSSVGGHFEEKDSDSQDIDLPSCAKTSFVVRGSVKHPPEVNDRHSVPVLCPVANSDSRRWIPGNDNNDNETESNNVVDLGERANASNAAISTGNSTAAAAASSTKVPYRHDEEQEEEQKTVVKTEIKRETDRNSIFYESYDEIEERLKQICDGYRGEENGPAILGSVGSLRQTRVKQERRATTVQVPRFHRTTVNYGYSPRNQIGDVMLADSTGNIEVIFGSESADECATRCLPVSHAADDAAARENDVSTRHNPGGIDRVASEPAQPSFARVMPVNMRAVMKRKRRTREEMMESIEKSVRSAAAASAVSSQDDMDDMDDSANSTSDLSDNEAAKRMSLWRTRTRRRKRRKGKEAAAAAGGDSARSDHDHEDDPPAAGTGTARSLAMTRFTVKVTGDRDDVVDIMQDLFRDTKDDFVIQENDDAESSTIRGNDASVRSVTSVITIDDYCHRTNAANRRERDSTLCAVTSSIASRGNDDDTSTCPVYAAWPASTFDLELDTLRMNDDHRARPSVNGITERPIVACAARQQYRKLREKIKMQENVIKQLTDQLILYKDLEKDLHGKNLLLETKTKEMENLMCEFNERGADDALSSASSYKRNLESTQRLTVDLSNRISYFEDMNKKLMKTITVECQQKRKLESEVKQRDNRIKELNWKLEKASKFLERAEKNTNTYRRKMLNMQTFMRRKKLLDEKMSKFNEMLTDSTKDNYSDKALAMAMEVKQICGTDGYGKLLEFGFPLPALSALRTLQDVDNLSDFNDSNDQIAPAIGILKLNENEEQEEKQCQTVTTSHPEVTESTCREIPLDNTETVTGTVQDIFDENNDADDFSTNELREHFILQLNAVM